MSNCFHLFQSMPYRTRVLIFYTTSVHFPIQCISILGYLVPWFPPSLVPTFFLVVSSFSPFIRPALRYLHAFHSVFVIHVPAIDCTLCVLAVFLLPSSTNILTLPWILFLARYHPHNLQLSSTLISYFLYYLSFFWRYIPKPDGTGQCPTNLHLLILYWFRNISMFSTLLPYLKSRLS